MLDSCSKLFEKLVMVRLRVHLNSFSGLEDNQYGFRKARSVLGALGHLKEIAHLASNCRHIVGMLTLDVCNVFNSTSCEAIIKAVRVKQVFEGIIKTLISYLSDRHITMNSGNVY